MPLRLEERIGHAPADEHPVHFLEQPLQDADLVGHLGASEDRDEWPRRIAERAVQVPDFFLQEEAGDGRQGVRHAFG